MFFVGHQMTKNEEDTGKLDGNDSSKGEESTKTQITSNSKPKQESLSPTTASTLPVASTSRSSTPVATKSSTPQRPAPPTSLPLSSPSSSSGHRAYNNRNPHHHHHHCPAFHIQHPLNPNFPFALSQAAAAAANLSSLLGQPQFQLAPANFPTFPPPPVPQLQQQNYNHSHSGILSSTSSGGPYHSGGCRHQHSSHGHTNPHRGSTKIGEHRLQNSSNRQPSSRQSHLHHQNQCAGVPLQIQGPATVPLPLPPGYGSEQEVPAGWNNPFCNGPVPTPAISFPPLDMLGNST